MEDKSFRILWEIDIDAASAEDAARQALAGIISGVARTFEIHQWDEPEMVTASPIAFLDLKDPDQPEFITEPDRRNFTDQFMGPGLI